MKNLIVLVLTIILTAFSISCGGGGGPTIPVDDLVQEGQESLLNGDGSSAAASFEEALDGDADNPEANFGLAYVELMDIANDLVIFLSTDNDPYFHNVSMFVADPMLDFPTPHTAFLDPQRVLGANGDPDDVVIDDMTLEEIRLEILSILGSLESIRLRLKTTIDETAGDDEWTFNVPEDWNDPATGMITIWRADVLALSAALNCLMGTMHFAVAYSPSTLGIHQNEWGEIEITGITGDSPDTYTDTNVDGYIDFEEIAEQEGAPAGFGVLASGGAGHISSFVTYWRRSFTEARDAVDSLIAVNDPLNHWAFDDLDINDYNEFVADWTSYGRDYAGDLIAAFTGGVTLTFRPALIADNPEIDDDLGSDFTVNVDFAEFFTSLPNDIRDFPMRFEYDVWGDLVLPEIVSDAFTDVTILGLFPDGMSQELYDELYCN